MRTMTNWDKRFMSLASHVASWSKDRSTKVGVVIAGPANEVRALGFNGFPRGCDDNIEERHERPNKYFWTEHAERNAIYNAARVGTSVEGCRIYVPWFTCIDCARAIIQSGITEMICTQPDFTDKQWGRSFKLALEMLKECDVDITYCIDGTRFEAIRM